MSTTQSSHHPHVVIIGAGLSGLSAAYDLLQSNFRVTLIEASRDIGGLASSILVDGVPVERFYHFICRGDDDLLNLVDELGITAKLHWRQVSSSYFYQGKSYHFGTPFDLLRFDPIPPSQRIRFGLNILQSRYRAEWHSLDQIPAKQWLIDQVGPQAYNVIWDPLLRVKFGEAHDKISAAWIWHRINRVARSRNRLWEHDFFGYLENGSETVIDALIGRCRRFDRFQVRTGARIEKIGLNNNQVVGVSFAGADQFLPAGFVVSTMTLSQLTHTLPPDSEYARQLAQVKYLGVVCMLLQMNQPLSSDFWININDPRISFNGIIEYTNLNPRPDLHPNHLVYVPFYLHSTNERWNCSDEQLFAEYTHGLRFLNPAFGPKWVKQWWVSKAKAAQAVCHIGFANQVPDHRAPYRGLYLTDSTQYYPEDRTISAAIRLGRRVAKMIRADSEQP